MIELKNVTKKFKEVTALDHVSVSFESNHIYGLLGRNGAGKSTLLNLSLIHICFQPASKPCRSGAGTANICLHFYIISVIKTVFSCMCRSRRECSGSRNLPKWTFPRDLSLIHI